MSVDVMEKSLNEKIISVNQIREILEMYNIGKKPLAKLLGWGETTVIRYLEGDIPTSEYTEKLQEIAESPMYYYRILMENQSKITNVAFKKSKRAVLEAMMRSKLHVATQYIINQANAEINARQIQYILFYSQILSLVFLGEEIFEEDAQLTYNQMPYLNLYEALKKQGIRTIEMNPDKLSRNDKDIIDCVHNACGWYGNKAFLAIASVERKATEELLEGLKSKILTKDYLRNVYGRMFGQFQIKRYQDFPKYLQQRLIQAIGKDVFSVNIYKEI
ncbi:hypothetical protein [Lachnoclostridium phytofermentans]|uniref:Uncharacterized protein n=1 Tax=Lachnoclostridium phytofermentans (strain ATCC 700394 / DSM 18823 / ISDg) TaxID=357809 RepID=A9KHZ1_LACP7|nr:hypothetical protein [Lachnoclostridium phytofermentans]ABX43838.1 hypothetical protein Cphy_3487 [Lachnoclostridium phytofermentans ISDg]